MMSGTGEKTRTKVSIEESRANVYPAEELKEEPRDASGEFALDRVEAERAVNSSIDDGAIVQTPGPDGYEVTVEIGEARSELFNCVFAAFDCGCCKTNHRLLGIEPGHRGALSLLLAGKPAPVRCHVCGGMHRLTRALVTMATPVHDGAVNRHERRALRKVNGSR